MNSALQLLIPIVLLLGNLAAKANEPVSTPQNQLIVGSARVIDGDTLEVAGIRIRVHGIDAPEMNQTCQWPNKTIRCGEIARAAFLDLIAGGGDVRCEPIEQDRFGRTIARCYAPDGFDIGRNLVHTGWALAYRKYSRQYVATEESATNSKRGMWRGEFVPPWEWRRGKRLANTAKQAQPETRQPTTCLIKGNIARDGERIYHIPGGYYYDRTRINPSKGERWFCSEAEARASGWRQSRR